ncbi:MAG TPA: 5-(carboxyamino)imidazole ribonucleotide synthase [Candidatus Dormibacteraeota bacterium]|nr:5-(carboxyamino)imidazole ribonucleotide synthase [Candidatus Dormibacteraeota bacterium]
MSETVGVLGAGQLGRMLALAGLPLDLRFRFLDPDPAAPAAATGALLVGAYDDLERLAELARGAAAVTWEFENVPAASAERLQALGSVYPPPLALAVAQDRLEEKRLFERLQIPCAAYRAVDHPEAVGPAARAVGLPARLKTRRLGYDGRGQVVLEHGTDAEGAAALAALGGVPCLVEASVAFDRELSILGVRDGAGGVAVYPLVENHHAGGVLRLSLAPAPGLSTVLQASGTALCTRILEALDYRGVLAVECFEVGGRLLANEIAPRVHNSGHWTVEGAETSQFENHLRAGLGWPLGSTAARGVSAMANCLGVLPDPRAVLAVPGAHLHRYGKAPRAQRKVGHVTVTAEDAAGLRVRLAQLATMLPLPAAGLGPAPARAGVGA